MNNSDEPRYYRDAQYDVSDADQRRMFGIPDKSDKDWFTTPSGDKCAWCKDGLSSPFEPEDSDDADMHLCRGHVAEYEGLSLDGLDRMESEQAYDYL